MLHALKRILTDRSSGPYEVRLEQAISKAKVELDRELKLKNKGSAEQLKLLNNLLKSLERGSSNANTINKRWNALHDAGRIFINRDLKALTQGARTYELLDLDDRSDLALLKDGVSSARSIFAGKPGKTTPFADLRSHQSNYQYLQTNDRNRGRHQFTRARFFRSTLYDAARRTCVGRSVLHGWSLFYRCDARTHQNRTGS